MDERIVVLDGAWGTMLQQSGLGPEDYRGERFSAHPQDVTGDPDLLNLTRPDIVSGIHDAYLARGRGRDDDEHVHRDERSAQADYGLEDAVYEMNVEGARLARAACDAVATPERPRFVAGSVGPLNVTLSISARVDDPAFRVGDLRRGADAYAEQIAAWSRRRRSAPDRDGVRHAERQGGDRGGPGLSAPGRLPLVVSLTVVDRSGRTLSGQTVEAFWASIEHAGLLAVGDQLLARRDRDARPGWPSSRASRTCPSGATRMPACRTRSASYDERRPRRGAAARVRRERARERRRRLLRHDARAHRGDRRSSRRRSPRARSAARDATPRFAGLEPFGVGPRPAS